MASVSIPYNRQWVKIKGYTCRCAFLLGLALPLCSWCANAAVQEAVAALQHQDYKGAEQKLRAELKVHPADAETLSLLGISLDEQRRFDEGATFHKRALAAAPRSTAVLYNYANNLLATGDEKTAREMLLRAVAADPADHNANLALAQIAVNHRDGKEALAYLDRLAGAQDAAILRLAALDLVGRSSEASTLFGQLSAATQNDAATSAAFGQILSKAGQFEHAEAFYTQALAKDPANFQLLYSLGVTASQAGHNDRARAVLEAALRQQPNNVDVLYTLAIVYGSAAQPEAALRVLAQAAKIDPKRADVQKLTAINARNIKADEDSVAAWERYLKLVPGDDEARRERAFGKARLTLMDEALPDLRAYVTKHPDDPVGYYELGMAESTDDPSKGIALLDRAIALKPDLVAARAGRGILLYTENKPEAAAADLEFALKQIPEDAPERAALLDHLGQAYSTLDRLKDAVPVLRKAAELAPNDSTTLLHLANALGEAGQTEESEALMARFRQMNPGTRATKVTGVVDYLGMSAEERRKLYRARLEKTVHDRPEDMNSQVLYLKLLLTDNQIPEAIADAHRIAAMKPAAKTLADAGHALLAAKQYDAARELLGQAAATGANFDGLKLDVATATFHAAGDSAVAAEAGLKQLDTIPEPGRNPAYYLARAQMLDAAGKTTEAVASLQRAIASVNADPDLYWQASVLMTRNHRTDDALRLLEQAAKAMPDEAQIPVIRAGVLELAGKTDDARRVLSDAQRRWPEIAYVWVAQGVVLAAHQQNAEARKALDTAVALGAHSPQTQTLAASLAKSTGAPVVDPSQFFLAMPPQAW